METLVKKRAVIKTQLTLFEKYLDSAKLLVDSQSDLTQQKISELEIRLENSRTLLDKFNDVQLEIELLVSNDADLTSQILERETFENKYYKSVVSATAIISSSVKSLSCNEGAAGTSTPTYEGLRDIIAELLASMNSYHTKTADVALLKNLYDEMHGTHNAQDSANQNIETENLNNDEYGKAHHTEEAHLDKRDQNRTRLIKLLAELMI
ncbi:hypothetical protein RN001_007829 [Aquatica leii]|uniref:Uncharacterized protein n=1 Tax=Aquatica leii TaxID=1421715 RepID=A0AAN7PA12_9COLE|nr:hypothetical protein RN001_007829 [Aquatica leii]